MPAFSLGPFLVSFDRLAVIFAVATFMAATNYLSKRIDPRFSAWGTCSIVLFAITARATHVVRNFDNFRTEPLRSLNVLDGGFFWQIGLITVAILTVAIFRKARLIAWGFTALTLSAVVIAATISLAPSTPALPLPEGEIERLEGGLTALPAITGKPMVINLWATWCPPCRRELPMMAEVAKNTDIAHFIFADQGEDRSRVEAFLRQERIELPTTLLDSLGTLTSHYQTPGLPATLFVDTRGNLQAVHLGEISKEQLLSKLAELTLSVQP